MRTILLTLTAFTVVACSASDTTEIKKETTTQSSAATTSSGTGGAGGSSTQTGGGGPNGGAGGGGTVENDTGYESGSRLKARFYNGNDGSRLPVVGRLYDTQMQVDCVPVKVNGVHRCLPAAAISPFFYSDNACTIALLYATKGCVAPKYARTYDSTSCGASEQVSVYEALQPVTTVYQGTTNNCNAVQQATLDAYDFYALSTVDIVTSFEAMTLETEP